jgi:U4/U6 small nuclear ribonucleoprotein PRP3
MAATPANGLKRPHPNDELDGSQKRPRSGHGTPIPAPNGAGAIGKPDISKVLADARARAAEVAARLAKEKAGQNGGRTETSTVPTSGAPSSGVLDKVAEMRARVAAAKERAAAVAALPRTSSPAVPAFQPPQYDDHISKARGGLDVGLHPALMGDSGQDAKSTKSRQAMQPKFATTMANRRSETPTGSKQAKSKSQLDLSGPSLEEIKNNPYYDPSLGPQTTTAKGRIPRQLIFNQKGKYIQQATALRRQAALEAMKKRIAESSRKAGMIDDIESEKGFLVPEPPTVEWWDEGLIVGSDYSAIDSPNGLKIDTDDTVVTAYIQHPVAIEPPHEKKIPAPKPMYLTPKEQKKRRRQNRMADLKEKQMKVRLGLEPAAPPKVKKSNLMRVLGEEAVKDPTAVEARVNREIAERAQAHMQANQERKLSKEQRNEKLAAQQDADAAKGIYSTVYRIDSLANGRHRFKISKNAEQHKLTGICILHPKYCLVIVEGGQYSIKQYKKLMLNRIDWTENSGPNSVREGNQEAMAAWLQAEDEQGNLKDLGLNKCSLVWEGELKQRAFRKWGSKVCETDKDAKDALSRAKMEHFWTLAKTAEST